MDVAAASYELDINSNTLCCQGDWNLSGLGGLLQGLQLKTWPDQLNINLAQVQSIDTTGAWILLKLEQEAKVKGVAVEWIALSTEQQQVFSLLHKHEQVFAEELPPAKQPAILEELGQNSLHHLDQGYRLLSYVGQLTETAIRCIPRISMLQVRSTIQVIFRTGFTALPIIALLSFLVGIVLTYQMGIQLRNYGANIYIVDLLGLAILREFGPLMTAVIVAGRTSSAFTSEIATMKVTQEVDAMRSLGIRPNEVLVLPKILGLFIALPLLTFWADAFGLFGGAWIAHGMLEVSYHDFIHRFQEHVSLASFAIGIGKGPIFALIISVVGTFQGFMVKGGADAVGRQTTRSVVQSIFLIIIADAIISVLYSSFGV